MTQQEGSGETVWVGGDVSKDSVDIAVLDGPSWCVPMTGEGLEEVVLQLAAGHVHLVVESTGGYEELVVAVFRRAGARVSVVNPKRVRDFARACGQLAKADPVDARVLAHFGRAMRPRPASHTSPFQTVTSANGAKPGVRARSETPFALPSKSCPVSLLSQK